MPVFLPPFVLTFAVGAVLAARLACVLLGAVAQSDLQVPANTGPRGFPVDGLVCAVFNSDDCVASWQVAAASGDFEGFCQKCAEESSSPLPSRCQLCCAQCAGLDVCNENVSGPCAECVEREDMFCANNEWDSICEDACCGPTNETSVGCAEACRSAPRCGPCPSFNSEDCVTEWQTADASGSFDSFCQRCAEEGGSFPLRLRCQLCCAQCDGLDVCNENVSGPCRLCVETQDGFCASGSWDEQCLDACCGPTDTAPDGCAEACRLAPQCDNQRTTSAFITP